MGRLTKRTAGGTAYINYPKSVCFDDGTEDGIAVAAHRQKVIERLAAYEDTGFEPQQIKNAQETLAYFDNIGIMRGNEIVDAEEDGRLVVLPCKVGDTVYEVFKNRIYELKVAAISLTGGAHLCITIRNYRGARRTLEPDTIGETVFLTLEEAKTAAFNEGLLSTTSDNPDIHGVEKDKGAECQRMDI